MIQVSVIIPCYNCEDTIERCLDSLHKQIYNNYEIVVVNDGSTDSTLERIISKQKYIKNINIVDIPNGGVSNARNVGIQQSRGNYLIFVDSDDYVTEHYIENLISLKSNDLVVSGYISNGGGQICLE